MSVFESLLQKTFRDMLFSVVFVKSLTTTHLYNICERLLVYLTTTPQSR